MKSSVLLVLLLMAAALAAGCEMAAQTDNTSLTITDGSISSFQTRQGHFIITAPAGDQHPRTIQNATP